MASSGNKVKVMKVALRLLALVATLCAAMVMLSAHETPNIADSSIRVDFGDITSYWNFVFANFVAAVYSILVCCLNSKSKLWKLVVAVDAVGAYRTLILVLVAILLSSCASALTVACMEKNGNEHARWRPICSEVPSYCFRTFAAISVAFLAAAAYALLHLLSIQEAVDALLLN